MGRLSFGVVLPNSAEMKVEREANRRGEKDLFRLQGDGEAKEGNGGRERGENETFRGGKNE